MKFFLAGLAIVTASSATAGIATAYTTVTPSGSGDAAGALVVIVVLGALMLINGRGTTTRNTAPRESTDQTDDDVIMKF
ncbi:hypothetical protein [Octadecabacter sp. R77987]|uniref:hypothetical protein n=1 Tax=Octadecabacter sp. R77987 TaxID=3093874 RepID=UPI00366D2A1A